MRNAIASMVAGALLATAATAAAHSEAGFTQYGITCKSGAQAGGIVACVRESGTGYAVGISRSAILVIDTRSGRRVFSRAQP